MSTLLASAPDSSISTSCPSMFVSFLSDELQERNHYLISGFVRGYMGIPKNARNINTDLLNQVAVPTCLKFWVDDSPANSIHDILVSAWKADEIEEKSAKRVVAILAQRLSKMGLTKLYKYTKGINFPLSLRFGITNDAHCVFSACRIGWEGYSFLLVRHSKFPSTILYAISFYNLKEGSIDVKISSDGKSDHPHFFNCDEEQQIDLHKDSL